jgi:twitching motility protein PilT
MRMHHMLLETLLETMAHCEGSDLHIKSGAVARARVSGEIAALSDEPVSEAQMEAAARALVGDAGLSQLKREKKGLDTYYLSEAGRRYRVNLFLHLKGFAAVFRVIASESPPLEVLGLPPAVADMARLQRGLVLVTGSTGSGKSTTLTAMIDLINREQPKHIVTIEDPVEFVHSDIRSIIEQRNIGEHASDFASALKDALREDPDIILVGEMRDMETINMALHAANTGHLVFSTLHTLDAKETVSRVIGVFPAPEQNRVRLALAAVLQGVIAQRLVRSTDGGRVAAVEVMKVSARIREMIRHGREHEILDAIEEGSRAQGMQSFDQALLALVREGKIGRKEALSNATRPADLMIALEGESGYGGEVIALKESEPLPEQALEVEIPDPSPVRGNLLKSIRSK